MQSLPGVSQLESLPKDLQTYIFSFLSDKSDIEGLKRLSKYFHKLFQDEKTIAQIESAPDPNLRKLANCNDPELVWEVLDRAWLINFCKVIPHQDYENLFCYFLYFVITVNNYDELIKQKNHRKNLLKTLIYDGFQNYPKIVMVIIDNALRNDYFFRYKLVPNENTYEFLPSDLNMNDTKCFNSNAYSLIHACAFQIYQKKYKESCKFKIVLTSQQRDIINIAIFLATKDAVIIELEKLEKQLHDRASSGFNPNTKSQTVSVIHTTAKHYKSLSSYLCEWAKENKFRGYAKLQQSLNPNIFFSVLKTGSLFKDKVFRHSSHGEWSHFIQWWCIVEHNRAKRNNNCTFLLNEPAKLLCYLGEISYQKGGKQLNALFDPWTYTFESGEGFRTPDTLHSFLCSDIAKNNFPILHHLISGRDRKPQAEKKSPGESPYIISSFS